MHQTLHLGHSLVKQINSHIFRRPPHIRPEFCFFLFAPSNAVVAVHKAHIYTNTYIQISASFVDHWNNEYEWRNLKKLSQSLCTTSFIYTTYSIRNQQYAINHKHQSSYQRLTVIPTDVSECYVEFHSNRERFVRCQHIPLHDLNHSAYVRTFPFKYFFPSLISHPTNILLIVMTIKIIRNAFQSIAWITNFPSR